MVDKSLFMIFTINPIVRFEFEKRINVKFFIPASTEMFFNINGAVVFIVDMLAIQYYAFFQCASRLAYVFFFTAFASNKVY